MAPVEVINSQSVVERVTSLPLVSSTYILVSNMYSITKENHPYIRSVCEAAEQGVRTVTAVALTTASPIIDKLEPQIVIANELACKGLDRVESGLSILHQPSDQIVSHAKEVVTSAVEKTRDAALGGMEKTKAVVTGSVGTVMESRVGRVVSRGVDSALATFENLVELYLPVREHPLELESDAVDDPSYYIRLGSLSSKVRKRVSYRFHDGRRRSMDFISTVDLTGYGRRNVNEANQMINNKISSLMRWKSSSVQHQNSHQAEVIESRSLTQNLQTTSLVLVSGLQALQQGALSLRHSASQTYSSFRTPSVLEGLPDASLAAPTQVQLGTMKDSFENVLDYLVNNTPLNWLVGPFYPSIPPSSPSRGGPRGGRCSNI